MKTLLTLLILASIVGMNQAIASGKPEHICSQTAAPPSFWDGCSTSVRTQLETLYNTMASNLKSRAAIPGDGIFSKPLGHFPPAGVLNLRRLRRGDPHGVALKVNLGFSEQKAKDETDSEQEMLLPPATFEEFFDIAVRNIRAMPGPHIFPAITFVRRFFGKDSLKNVTKYEDVRIITPGIDPWPEEQDWELAEGVRAQLRHGVWRESMSQGRMPFSFALFNHDIGHLTELFVPGMAAEIYRYYTETITAMPQDFINTVDLGIDLGVDPYSSDPERPKHFWRLASLAELFSLPRQTAFPVLNSKIGIPLDPQKLPQVKEYAKTLTQNFDETKIRELGRWIVDHKEDLLLKVGGSTRDTYTTLENLSVEKGFVRTKIKQTFLNQTNLIETAAKNGIVKTLHVETLFGWVRQIELLLTCNTEHPWNGCDVIAELNTSVNQEIIQNIARLHLASAAAAKENLDPASAFRWGTAIPMDDKNPVRNYIRAFMPESSFLYFLFVSP